MWLHILTFTKHPITQLIDTVKLVFIIQLANYFLQLVDVVLTWWNGLTKDLDGFSCNMAIERLFLAPSNKRADSTAACQSVQTWRNLTYSMTKLFTESFNAYQMRPTHCAPYQYYFDRNSCLMVACQYFDICIWRECCNAVVSICRSMEGVKKHPSICLLLSAMKIQNICCGHSTLKGVTFGTSVSVSDVQYTVSNLLSISLVGMTTHGQERSADPLYCYQWT